MWICGFPWLLLVFLPDIPILSRWLACASTSRFVMLATGMHNLLGRAWGRLFEGTGGKEAGLLDLQMSDRHSRMSCASSCQSAVRISVDTSRKVSAAALFQVCTAGCWCLDTDTGNDGAVAVTEGTILTELVKVTSRSKHSIVYEYNN